MGKKVANPDAKQSFCVVRDHRGGMWGPFPALGIAAQEWAQKKWPDIPHFDDCDDPDKTPHWDIVIIRPPD